MSASTDDLGRALSRTAPRPATTGGLEGMLERARREGLIDVAYARHDSPFGKLLLAATEGGVVRVGLGNERHDAVLEELAALISPRVLEAPARLDPARRELERYFAGDLREFSVRLDWRLVHGFQTRVLHATARIPYGETRSYGEVAEAAGNPRAFRAAGTALGHNPLPVIVPCHRVLRAGGVIGNYGGGPRMKEALLELEGALD